MKLNHSLKFSTSKGPTLDEFTLGYIFAACEDLDKYPEFFDKEATVNDLSHMSVIMMRDEAEHVFNQVESQLKKAQTYNNINMSQFGHDLWLSTNEKPCLYVCRLPDSVKDGIIFSYNYHGNPCELKKKDGNYVLEFKDPKTEKEKNNIYCETYKALTIIELIDPENGEKLIGKQVPAGTQIITTINRSSEDLRNIADKLINQSKENKENITVKPKL